MRKEIVVYEEILLSNRETKLDILNKLDEFPKNAEKGKRAHGAGFHLYGILKQIYSAVTESRSAFPWYRGGRQGEDLLQKSTRGLSGVMVKLLDLTDLQFIQI